MSTAGQLLRAASAAPPGATAGACLAALAPGSAVLGLAVLRAHPAPVRLGTLPVILSRDRSPPSLVHLGAHAVLGP